MFHDILVPVDLSDKNLTAVDVAAGLAAHVPLGGSNPRLTLLHVIETIDHVPYEELEDFYDTLQEKAEAGLVELADRAADQAGTAEVRRRVVYGHRARSIVDFATQEGCDLIVLSSHRVDPERRGEDWATISHKVAILAPCPVLLVK